MSRATRWTHAVALISTCLLAAGCGGSDDDGGADGGDRDRSTVSKLDVRLSSSDDVPELSASDVDAASFGQVEFRAPSGDATLEVDLLVLRSDRRMATAWFALRASYDEAGAEPQDLFELLRSRRPFPQLEVRLDGVTKVHEVLKEGANPLGGPGVLELTGIGDQPRLFYATFPAPPEEAESVLVRWDRYFASPAFLDVPVEQ